MRKSKEAKEKYLDKKCKDIEVLTSTDNRDAAYKSIKKFFNDYKQKRGSIDDYNGVIIYKDKHRGNIWKEYLEQLYEGPELIG